MEPYKKGYEFLSHTADVKFRAYGKSLDELFKNASEAMSSVLIPPSQVRSKAKKKIRKESLDIESLLFDFLEEFIYLMDTENFILSTVESVKICEKTKPEKGAQTKVFILDAEVSGDSAQDYDFSGDIKSITHHEMYVKKEKDRYVAQVVVDV